MEPIVRYTHPTKYDQAPIGSLWKCIIDPTCTTIYIQVSNDSTKPQWLRIGAFFEDVFKQDLENRGFLIDCLSRYHRNTAS